MPDYNFHVHSWPRVIAHIDADAFFTSCEEATHPDMKGKPMITGSERGIIACANYPAKAIGIKRGVSLWDAKKLCPDLISLPSDYETYSLFSRRMFDIMRKYTPAVEEYSIDEAFLDITGCRRTLRCTYEDVPAKIREEISRSLGITVSAGLSVSKVLAKIGSKHNKPNGMTIIPGRQISDYLRDLPVENIWGIGRATTEYLSKMNVRTALQFATLPENIIRKRFSKPGIEIWLELRGISVLPVNSAAKSVYASITKSATFSPSSGDPEYLFAHLLRHLEAACAKSRNYLLAPKRIAIFLRLKDYNTVGNETKLTRPSVYPLELTSILRGLFDSVYRKNILYRATGTILLDLVPDTNIQYSLFDEPVLAENIRKVYEAADAVNSKFGKHTIHLGGAHLIEQKGDGRRGEPTQRSQTVLKGETRQRHLGLPIFQLTSTTGENNQK